MSDLHLPGTDPKLAAKRTRVEDGSHNDSDRTTSSSSKPDKKSRRGELAHSTDINMGQPSNGEEALQSRLTQLVKMSEATAASANANANANADGTKPHVIPPTLSHSGDHLDDSEFPPLTLAESDQVVAELCEVVLAKLQVQRQELAARASTALLQQIEVAKARREAEEAHDRADALKTTALSAKVELLRKAKLALADKDFKAIDAAIMGELNQLFLNK